MARLVDTVRGCSHPQLRTFFEALKLGNFLCFSIVGTVTTAPVRIPLRNPHQLCPRPDDTNLRAEALRRNLASLHGLSDMYGPQYVTFVLSCLYDEAHIRAARATTSGGGSFGGSMDSVGPCIMAEPYLRRFGRSSVVEVERRGRDVDDGNEQVGGPNPRLGPRLLPKSTSDTHRLLNTGFQAFPALLVARLLRAIEAGGDGAKSAATSAIQLVLLLMTKMVVENRYFYESVEMAAVVRGSLAGMMSDKSLRLPAASAAGVSGGSSGGGEKRKGKRRAQ